MPMRREEERKGQGILMTCSNDSGVSEVDSMDRATSNALASRRPASSISSFCSSRSKVMATDRANPKKCWTCICIYMHV
jgi:hypothetical protein